MNDRHEIGLGLSISKQIITQYGGDIAFESVYQSGSLFTFQIQMEQCNSERNSSVSGLSSKSITFK